jgi:hypothetical protein
MALIEQGIKFLKEHKIESVVCRNCDLAMKFERENPHGYFLFKYEHCGNRVCIQTPPEAVIPA